MKLVPRVPSMADRRGLAMAALFGLCLLWCANAFLSSNAMTRLGLTQSIVRDGTANIDHMASHTIDKALFRGHYYCDKSPGISLICTPAAALANLIADAMGAEPELLLDKAWPAGVRYGLVSYACFLSSTVLFAALGLVAFRRSLISALPDQRVAAGITLVLAFGSPYFIWSTTLFGHATATACLLLGFALAWHGAGPGTAMRPRLFALAGFWLGLAALVDLTAAPAAAFIGVYLLALRARSSATGRAGRAVALIAGALPAGAALLTYNLVAFGDPFHIGYGSVVGFAGMKVGLFGVSWPSWTAFYGITLSAYRGLIWISPISLLAFAVALVPGRREHRASDVLAMAIGAYYLLLSSGYQYWDGGYSLGPRHLTPAVPFVLFALGLRLAQAGTTRRRVVAVTGALSILVTVLSVCVVVEVPNDGRAMLLAHVIPGLLHGDSDLGLAKLGVPFALLVTVPVLLVAAVAAIIWPRASAGKPAARPRPDPANGSDLGPDAALAP